MFDRAEIGDRAIVVHMDIQDDTYREDLDEFKELVTSAGAEILDIVTTKRNRPEVKYFVGSGKAKEIAELVKLTEADVVLFNHALSPSQERNLETIFECRVLDRTGLILDIFA
ncbi:MAG: GTPase HflX, partial [Gammaproteobacteria bacterium]|nr:GTPase HflX [Gammaproteobacteria bacterium]